MIGSYSVNNVCQTNTPIGSPTFIRHIKKVQSSQRRFIQSKKFLELPKKWQTVIENIFHTMLASPGLSCTKSNRTLAKECGVSTSLVNYVRKWLSSEEIVDIKLIDNKNRENKRIVMTMHDVPHVKAYGFSVFEIMRSNCMWKIPLEKLLVAETKDIVYFNEFRLAKTPTGKLADLERAEKKKVKKDSQYYIYNLGDDDCFIEDIPDIKTSYNFEDDFEFDDLDDIYAENLDLSLEGRKYLCIEDEDPYSGVAEPKNDTVYSGNDKLLNHVENSYNVDNKGVSNSLGNPCNDILSRKSNKRILNEFSYKWDFVQRNIAGVADDGKGCVKTDEIHLDDVTFTDFQYLDRFDKAKVLENLGLFSVISSGKIMYRGYDYLSRLGRKGRLNLVAKSQNSEDCFGWADFYFPDEEERERFFAFTGSFGNVQKWNRIKSKYARLFDRYKDHSGLGVALRKDIICIDIDTKDTYLMESIRNLVPGILVQETPRGYHLFVRDPHQTLSGVKLNKIDILKAECHVAIFNPEKDYKFISGDIQNLQKLPEDFLNRFADVLRQDPMDLLSVEPEKDKSRVEFNGGFQLPEDIVMVGYRNTTMMRYAFSLRGKGYTLDCIEEAIREFSEDPHSMEMPLQEREIQSLMRYVAKKPDAPDFIRYVPMYSKTSFV